MRGKAYNWVLRLTLYFQVNQAAYNGVGTNKAPIALYHIAVMQ